MADWSAISKIILYICATVVIIFTTHSCELRTEIIQECEQSCSGMGNRILSVTNRECVCTGTAITESKQDNEIWLIPRNE